MILVPEDEIPLAKATMSDGQIMDPPPVYVASLPPHHTIQAPPKPTNYVHINRRGSPIKGLYVIDPFLTVPRSLLPPLPSGEAEDDRKNVKFETRSGAIDVDISLLGDAEDPNVGEAKPKKRTSLDVKSEHGSMRLKISTCPSPSAAPAPFHLNVTGRHGSINIWLPRTFQGPMTIYSRHGSVKFSNALSERMGLCNEIDHSRRCFVGDLSLFNGEEDNWKGDELNVKTEHAGVKVWFVDEVEPETPSGKSRLLSKVFGVVF